MTASCGPLVFFPFPGHRPISWVPVGEPVRGLICKSIGANEHMQERGGAWRDVDDVIQEIMDAIRGSCKRDACCKQKPRSSFVSTNSARPLSGMDPHSPYCRMRFLDLVRGR